MAWDEVRRPDDQAPPVEIEDPLDAQTADMIEGRFLVVGRRGEGSSGIALAVLDDNSGDDKEVILKVARDDAAGRRLDVEAEVLGGLEHPRVVRLVETLELGGRRVLLMSDAGKETLATRLAKEGQSTLEQLQRWGTDLLEAMAYLVDVQGRLPPGHQAGEPRHRPGPWLPQAAPDLVRLLAGPRAAGQHHVRHARLPRPVPGQGAPHPLRPGG